MSVTNSNNTNKDEITFVLMCSGNSNPDSYRPNSQESQWVMRRDALVRCSIACLFTTDDNEDENEKQKGVLVNTNNINDNNKLILFHDEDYSLMKMSRIKQKRRKETKGSSLPIFVPTEHNLIKGWKRAAQSQQRAQSSTNHNDARNSITIGDLEVECIHNAWKNSQLNNIKNKATLNSPHHNYNKKSSSNTTSKSTTTEEELLPFQKMIKLKSLGKKQWIEIIQSYCHSSGRHDDFLKKHHLNSSSTVIARKMNKQKLFDVYKELEKQIKDEKKQVSSSSSASLTQSNTDNYDCDENILELTFRYILSSTSHTHSPSNANESDTMVVVLHEDCDFGLEVFNSFPSTSRTTQPPGTKPKPKRIFVFLGAVRDMKEKEYKALNKACLALNIDLPFSCNLGKTPEFTSKIITAFQFHHSMHKIIMLDNNNSDSSSSSQTSLSVTSALSNALDILRNKTKQKQTQKQDKNGSPQNVQMSQSLPSPPIITLHTFLLIPHSSDSVTTSGRRSDISDKGWLFQIVRICVSSLWRSRIVCSSSSSSSSSSTTNETMSPNTISSSSRHVVENKLTLLFTMDGVELTLNSQNLVTFLAEKHQAAPTEYQILQALEEMLLEKKKGNNMNKIMDSSFSTGSLKNIVLSSLEEEKRRSNTNNMKNFYVLDFYNQTNKKEKNRSLVDLAYNNSMYPCDNSKHEQQQHNNMTTNSDKNIRNNVVFCVLALNDLSSSTKSQNIGSSKVNETYQQITKIFNEHVESSSTNKILQQKWFNNSCIDSHAIIITMIQHLHYHHRLLTTLQLPQCFGIEQKQETGKKRKYRDHSNKRDKSLKEREKHKKNKRESRKKKT